MLLPLLEEVLSLKIYFDDLSVCHIYKEQNMEENTLSKKGVQQALGGWAITKTEGIWSTTWINHLSPSKVNWISTVWMQGLRHAQFYDIVVLLILCFVFQVLILLFSYLFFISCNEYHQLCLFKLHFKHYIVRVVFHFDGGPTNSMPFLVINTYKFFLTFPTLKLGTHIDMIKPYFFLLFGLFSLREEAWDKNVYSLVFFSFRLTAMILYAYATTVIQWGGRSCDKRFRTTTWNSIFFSPPLHKGGKNI